MNMDKSAFPTEQATKDFLTKEYSDFKSVRSEAIRYNMEPANETQEEIK